MLIRKFGELQKNLFPINNREIDLLWLKTICSKVYYDIYIKLILTWLSVY